MRPLYHITPRILDLIAQISEKIGEVNASFLINVSPRLRKQNQIKTIHSSLQIEGNTLTADQITAILDNKKVIGPAKDILEVRNAIEVYQAIPEFTFDSLSSFLKAHKKLMNQLVEHPGSFRNKGVGIIKGSKVEHVAPPAENIPYLMKELFSYLKKDEELILIKSCVFHYELEFIHPFIDGNGRMGRLWQTIILVSRYPVLQYLGLETLISKNQNEYYQVLAKCDNAGNSTGFIEFMLQQINQSLDHLLKGSTSVQLTQENRLEYFVSLQYDSFTRKDYMIVFKNISGATASRDLKAGLEKGLFSKQGDKRLTTYKLN